MTKISAVLFDFDGTLVDTLDHIVQTYTKTLGEYGIATSEAAIVAVIGKTFSECYEELTNNHHDIKSMMEHHREIQNTPEMLDLIKSYDAVHVVLDELSARGVKLGIVTNRTPNSMNTILSMTNLKDYFVVRVTPDDVKVPKPDPEGIMLAAKLLGVPVHECIFVGDTDIDILTGKAAEVAVTIGMTHGYGSNQSLKDANVDALIDSFADLHAAIQKIEGSDALPEKLDHKTVEEYVLSMPNAKLDYPFGEGVAVYKVGEKMFAIIPDDKMPVNISLKCEPGLAIKLREQYETVMGGYHLNKKHWNTILLTGQVPWYEVQSLIQHSYDLVVNGKD